MKPAVVHFALNLLLSLFFLSAGLALYDHLVVRPAMVIGVVDVAEVYRSKEAEFTRLLTQTASEESRQRALLMEELPRDCSCLVIVKTALAGPTRHTVDLTTLLRQKVDAP